MWFVVAKKLGWILIILILISTMMRKSVYFGYKIICINVQLFFSSNSYNSMYLVHVCSTKKRSENKVGKHYSIIGMWIPISVHNWSELCDNFQCLTMCKVFANTWFQSKRHTKLLFFFTSIEFSYFIHYSMDSFHGQSHMHVREHLHWSTLGSECVEVTSIAVWRNHKEWTLNNLIRTQSNLLCACLVDTSHCLAANESSGALKLLLYNFVSSTRGCHSTFVFVLYVAD